MMQTTMAEETGETRANPSGGRRRSRWARAAVVAACAALGVGSIGGSVSAAGPAAQGVKDKKAAVETIALPDGFAPEGIATDGSSIYVGSIPTGAIYKANVRSGEGDVLVPAVEGRQAIGLDYQTRGRNVWAAGGPTGMGYVYDARTGETVAELTLTDPGTFVNDVIVTRSAAYFTDSAAAQFYRVPLDRRGNPGAPETVALGGNWEQVEGFNANGIETLPNGNLVIVNSTTGDLFQVNPESGVAKTIVTDGFDVMNGDGLARRGSRLYVVQNQQNKIVELKLDRGATEATLVETITSDSFDVPTTVALRGRTLFAVNARFGTPVEPTTAYTVSVVDG